MGKTNKIFLLEKTQIGSLRLILEFEVLNEVSRDGIGSEEISAQTPFT